MLEVVKGKYVKRFKGYVKLETKIKLFLLYILVIVIIKGKKSLKSRAIKAYILVVYLYSFFTNP